MLKMVDIDTLKYPFGYIRLVLVGEERCVTSTNNGVGD